MKEIQDTYIKSYCILRKFIIGLTFSRWKLHFDSRPNWITKYENISLLEKIITVYVICHLDFQRIIVTIVTIQMYVSFNPPFEFSLEKGNLKQADLSRSLLICSLAKVYTHHLNLLLDYVLYLPIKPYLIIWWKGEFCLLMMMMILMLSKISLKSLIVDIFDRKCSW